MKCPNRNKFCIVCGFFVPPNKKRNITKGFVNCYESYFVLNLLKSWYVPEIVCDYCYRGVLRSQNTKQTHNSIKYIYPVIWLRRSEHSAESCYFCRSCPHIMKVKYCYREELNYYCCESVKPAVLRSASNVFDPSEGPPQDADLDESEVEFNDENISVFRPSEYQFGCEERHLISQSDFDDLVRDMGIAKEKSELLASRLQEWKLVSPDFRVTSSRKRSKVRSFDQCFQTDDETGITYATDIAQLFETIGNSYDPDEWRLFIDGSVKSLKGVLLHNGNAYPSVPIVYGTDLKENYDNMKKILMLINYDIHRWVICCDLKIVAILMGLKKGYAKHQCFLCLWEGRRSDLHYTEHQWQHRQSHQIGTDSVENMPLVPSSKIILPPLHIKLGLIRNFVRALDSQSAAMAHLKIVFPKLSEAKIDAGMY